MLYIAYITESKFIDFYAWELKGRVMKLVGDGFVLFVLGQTVVFLFIFLMVAFINITAAILRRFEGEPEIVSELTDDDEAAEVAAAVAAVQQSRANS